MTISGKTIALFSIACMSVLNVGVCKLQAPLAESDAARDNPCRVVCALESDARGRVAVAVWDAHVERVDWAELLERVEQGSLKGIDGQARDEDDAAGARLRLEAQIDGVPSA